MDRDVVLVTGPPCAGKTTLVQRLRQPGDLVADHDRIARALGSPVPWGHAQEIRDAAEFSMRRRIQHAATMSNGRAWIIRSVPSATARAALAERLRATRVLVLLPPTAVLEQRATARPYGTLRTIRAWLARYRPAACDELVTNADLVVA